MVSISKLPLSVCLAGWLAVTTSFCHMLTLLPVYFIAFPFVYISYIYLPPLILRTMTTAA